MRSGDVFIGRNDLCWLAGLLEGEGSFMVGTPARPRTVSLSVNMTDKDVIERFASLVISGIQLSRLNVPNLKPQYRAQVGGGSGVSLMRILLPHMGCRRREQIQRVIKAYQPKIPYGHRHYHLLEDAVEEHDRYWLAGYLEGEGSFSARKFTHKDKIYRYPDVEVNSTDEDIIERVQRLWAQRYGVEVNIWSKQPKYPGSKRVYRIEASNTAARTIMADLYPLLGERRRAKLREVLGAEP
jgi:hypothetical protein